MEQVAKQAQFFGKKLPKKAGKKVDLLPGLGAFLRAWCELDTERQLGDFGRGPIPWSSIDRYAVTIGYRGVDRDHFMRVIRKTDNLILEQDAKRRESARVAAKTNANSQGTAKRPADRPRGRNARR